MIRRYVSFFANFALLASLPTDFIGLSWTHLKWFGTLHTYIHTPPGQRLFSGAKSRLSVQLGFIINDNGLSFVQAISDFLTNRKRVLYFRLLLPVKQQHNLSPFHFFLFLDDTKMTVFFPVYLLSKFIDLFSWGWKIFKLFFNFLQIFFQIGLIKSRKILKFGEKIFFWKKWKSFYVENQE